MQRKDNQKKVAIILLNMNNKELIYNCINSIKKNTSYKNYKIILSDNGSSDGSLKLIKKKFKDVNIIENKKNLGFAGGNNVGAKYALEKYDSDYVLLLNNDTLITHKDWLNKFVEAGEKIPSAGIIGCRLIYPNGNLQHYALKKRTYILDNGEKRNFSEKEKKELNKIREVDYVIGAAFLVKRNLIDKIGLLDQRFFPIYGEEIDYCERARKNGFKVIYTPHTTIIHIRSQTTDPKKVSKHWFFSKKNSIRLELLNFSLSKIIYWQIVHFGAAFMRKEKGKIKFRRNFLERLGFLIKAYSANLKDFPEILDKRKNRDRIIW